MNDFENGRIVSAASDITISPTYVPDLVNAALDLLIDGEHGIWHLANSGAVTWAEFARVAARKASYDQSRIVGRPGLALEFRARRPVFTALSSERGFFMPDWE